MSITADRIQVIKQRSLDEAARTTYPAGFPALPRVPAARYSDSEFAELEYEAVFRRSWLMVAHRDEVAEPGSYKLLNQLNEPVMLVRDHDGAVRGFYNVCKHRGSAIVHEESGNTGRRLTCPYHNWVYTLDGELAGYPEPDNFVDLDTECLSLTPVRTESWGPFIFVNLSGDAAPLSEFLGTVGRDLAEIGDFDGRLHLVGHTVQDVPVNWKIPVDANIETYHVNYVHKETAAKALRQPATGIQLLGNGHSRMLIGMQEGIDFATPLEPLFAGVGDLPLSGTFSYHLFPNLSVVFAGPSFVFLITNWPTSATTSTYHVHWCASSPADDPVHAEFLKMYVKFNRKVLFEDLTVLPGIQASINAGALDAVTLSYQERRIYHVHEAIDRAIGSERVPEHLRVPQLLGAFTED